MASSDPISGISRTGIGPVADERLPAADAAELESSTTRMGRDLLHRARDRQGKGTWAEQVLTWALADPAFKVQLFRFVDVFPMLHTSAQVYDYLREYLAQPGVTLPGWLELGLKAGRLARGALAATVANRVTSLANQFIGGRDATATLPQLERLWNKGFAFSLDLLGEACVSEEEALAYQRRYLELISLLAERTPSWRADPVLESDHLGPIPRANVSIKVSALSSRADAIDWQGSLDVLQTALQPILESAAEHNVLINFDMEHHALKDLTIELFRRCCERFEFPAGLALQAYLCSAEEDAEQLIQWARGVGRQVTVRLIKGAYWDFEVMRAEQRGWPVPVWTEKPESDACFERLTERFLASAPQRAGEGGVKLALGTHNVRSLARGLALLEKRGLPPAALEIQMLYGMADPVKAIVRERGLRLRQYVPLGELIPGMAYLVRRLLENTSNQSWLRTGFLEQAPDEHLLASPHSSRRLPVSPATEADDGRQVLSPQLRLAERHQLSPAVVGLDDARPFFNEPLRDFSQRKQRERFAAAIRDSAVPVVDGQLTLADARQAVAQAAAAFPAWRDRPPRERASILLGAAAGLRAQRDLLSGIMIREAGKTWREADADVCEAIDFCEYYAREAAVLFAPRPLGRFVAEANEIRHQPRGVAVVISPWNFPLAICLGMTSAALVTGNTVVVKPASPTRGIAQAMCDALWRAGVPVDALQFLPVSGEIGAALVRDHRVALIAFTGSREVGLDILRAAAETSAAQGFVKKVVCEMGGKNAIVVDESADLDEAVLGVRQSAFGYSGQKCSACSRAIVVEAVYDVFLRRLVASTRDLMVGDPRDPGTDIGPVINADAERKIRQYIAIGQTEGTLELACDIPPGLEELVGKPYVGPHIFSNIRPEHRLANEEIFGPVLSVLCARDFEEALDWANATSYKLTGGVFSRKPSHLDLARREFRVGNLYLNRGITGALVGRQPFGGFGLSGTGTQAGGPEYLLHFVEPRSICENTLRHGFAPGLD